MSSFNRQKPPQLDTDPKVFTVERTLGGLPWLHWTECDRLTRRPLRAPRPTLKKLRAFPTTGCDLCSACQRVQPLSPELLDYNKWAMKNPLVSITTRVNLPHQGQKPAPGGAVGRQRRGQ